MLGILASRQDVASMELADQLLQIADAADASLADERVTLSGAELRIVDERHLDVRAVDTLFVTEVDWIAVLSRHSGETGPLLTGHFPGNIGDAAFGGEKDQVPPACPPALAEFVTALEDRAPEEYTVGIECTHHGPTDSDRPIMFVEVGSDPPNWEDPHAARAVASALWSIKDAGTTQERQFVGFGGGHYAPRFHRILRETSWAVGHIAPDWALDELSSPARRRAIFDKLFRASDTRYAVITGDRPALQADLDAVGATIVSERWLRATSVLPIPVVRSLEDDLEAIDDGLVLGEQTVDSADAYMVARLPSGLLQECAGIDYEATEQAISATTVAYQTDNSSGDPAHAVAIAATSDIGRMVHRLCTILERKYDKVERFDQEIAVERAVFDPDRARDLGVPDGPLFGTLAGGQSVEIDGDTIQPECVHKTERVTFGLPETV